MKQKIKIIITFLLLAFLAFPGAGAFKSTKAAHAEVGETVASQAGIISVIAAPILSTITVVHAQPEQSASCVAVAETSDNILQNANVANLNQLPSCFNLVPQTVANQQSLNVVPLVASAVIVVVANSHFSTPPDYLPGPVSGEKSVPLVALFGIILALVIGEKMYSKLQKFTPRIRYALSLEQLQVMRC